MSMRTYRLVTTTLFFAFILAACFVRDHYVRAQQLRTYADMQTIVAEVEQIRSSISAPLTDLQVQTILDSVAQGRDAWGRRLLFRSKPSKAGFSYILVSYGSDGKPDVSSLEEYFKLPESRIQGDGRKDIVFRNGMPVTNAGK